MRRFGAGLVFLVACASPPGADVVVPMALLDVLEPRIVLGLAQGYRCTHGVWPVSAAGLRDYETAGGVGLPPVSERGWEVLSGSRFGVSDSGALLIEGDFAAGTELLPELDRPLEFRLQLDSDVCAP